MQSQTPIVINNPGNKIYGDAPFQLSVTGGSGSGAVSYAVTPSGILTVGSSGIVAIDNAGTATITVTKAADASYYSANASITINVSKRNFSEVTVSGIRQLQKHGGSDICYFQNQSSQFSN